jgi:phenylacetate-CoA ligase
MLIAAECGAHDGMHIQEENLLVEIVRDGRPAPPGEPGDVVVTDLHNLGMPMIRYVNGDVASLSPSGPCACGRGLARVARVDGRRADTLRDRDGNSVPGVVFHVLFSDARTEIVRQFQAVQGDGGAVVLRIVRGREYTDDAFAAITKRFSGYLRGLPLSVEFHDAIAPQTNTGKLKTVIVEKAPRREEALG